MAKLTPQLEGIKGFVIFADGGKIMVNTRSKMQRSNSKARKHLTEHGYSNIYFFPHSRFSKDYILDGSGFDGLCSKNGNICFFQVKSNCKPPKQVLEQFKQMSFNYNIRCIWINVRDRKPIQIFINGEPL